MDDRRYWGPEWLQANARIACHPKAAERIVGMYPARMWKDARRTAVCAASCNTPLWQNAVAAEYPATPHPEEA
jgi:hypothetical protein